MTINGAVSSAGAINLDVDGALTISAATQDALVTSHTGQTITADSIALNAQAGHRAVLQNLGSGDQTVQATAGGIEMNVVGGAGVAQIVNNTTPGEISPSRVRDAAYRRRRCIAEHQLGIFLNSAGGACSR